MDKWIKEKENTYCQTAEMGNNSDSFTFMTFLSAVLFAQVLQINLKST
jgi:hypothetical protein